MSAGAMEAPSTLSDRDMPDLFRGADIASQAGQRRYIRTMVAQMLLLLVAGVAGSLHILASGHVDVTGVLSAAAFMVAAFIGTYALRAKHDRMWYEGRAAAESAKTLAWRYAVGGDPYPIALPHEKADLALIGDLQELIESLDEVAPVVMEEVGDQITPAMRALRRGSLHQRRDAYRTGRIDDQRGWYARKARFNASRAQRWGMLMLVLEAAGGVAAVLKASGVPVILGTLSLAAIGSVAISSWMQTKQFEPLGNAYAVAAHELGAIRARLDVHRTEREWAQFVSDAERAISREHTLWSASRGHRAHEAAVSDMQARS